MTTHIMQALGASEKMFTSSLSKNLNGKVGAVENYLLGKESKI
jgi:hypothetical protein